VITLEQEVRRLEFLGHSLLVQKMHLCLVLQVFVNARLHVSGGALGGGRMVEDASSVAGWFSKAFKFPSFDFGIGQEQLCAPIDLSQNN
jgi:hypothetical protein